MKVILLQDVAKVGKRFEVKEVSDGYGRNFLIARKLARIATPEAVKSLATMIKQHAEMNKVHDDLINKNLAELKDLKITIEEKANEKGHLFSAVHEKEISKVLKEQKGIDILPEIIELEAPIKEVGEHKVKVKDTEFILEIISKL